jgi:peptidoglycan/xylan/chitin deacetylase (PgdA/CDA1 family)
MAPSLRSLLKTALFDRIPGLLRRGPSTAPRVALTFDDGPDHVTERYLALLDKLGVPATFFLCGNRVEQRPDLVREYLRRGHQVASHGYDHTRFTNLSRPQLLDQCERTDRALGGQPTGRSWVRPPHGSLDPGNVLSLLAAGYTVALWSLDSQDHSDQNVESLVKRCTQNVSAGEVFLFHEGQPWTLEAMPHIVSALSAQGLECVTMHDLFAP